MFKGSLLACAVVLSSTVATYGATITYVTPTGSMTSGPVDASATLTTGSGTVAITITDLEANPTDVAQTVSDLEFFLSNGATTGTLSSSSGQQIKVHDDGTFTLGSMVTTGWGLNNNVGGGLQLDALGYVGPKGLIIGPPDTGGNYSNAKGSIAGNSAHNPFLDQTATFNVAVTGVTAATRITGVKFSFGTTEGQYIVTGMVGAPEPSAILLVLGGSFALVLLKRRSRVQAR